MVGGGFVRWSVLRRESWLGVLSNWRGGRVRMEKGFGVEGGVGMMVVCI